MFGRNYQTPEPWQSALLGIAIGLLAGVTIIAIGVLFHDKV